MPVTRINALAFQSTHPLRGATCNRLMCAPVYCISIHAPLAGCDAARPCSGTPRYHFNPRTPCGVRLARCSPAPSARAFQSTHPLRGATSGLSIGISRSNTISIHAPLAGCDSFPFACAAFARISIHAPLAGCDLCSAFPICASCKFQSTHPLRGATTARRTFAGCWIFQSTHPLRGATLPFLPPPPAKAFQSTHPLRGATRLSSRCLG